jgi:hypothetical protein
VGDGKMIERLCEQCGTEFELEAGDDSSVCIACIIELQKETREDRQLRKISEIE